MAKSLSNTNLVWLSEQEHVGTEDVEALIGKFEDRTIRPKANKYRRARGISSYKRSLVSEQNKMIREEKTVAARVGMRFSQSYVWEFMFVPVNLPVSCRSTHTTTVMICNEAS